MSDTKRMMYISRFADLLGSAEVQQIGRISKRNNAADDISGVLVAAGGVFFQVLEGPAERVDAAYTRILRDPRHKDIMCLRSESPMGVRQFPDWSMGTINIDEQSEEFALPIRAMMQSLEHAYRVIAKYTQPKISQLIVNGVNPLTIAPVKREVVVLYSDLQGFTTASESLQSEQVIVLLDTYIDICSRRIATQGGELAKFTGDGLLAYFDGDAADAAIEASLGILDELRATAEYEPEDSPFRHLRCGIGLARGTVLEGNVGSSSKKEFTIYGDAVNTAARVQDMTRTLSRPLLVTAEVRNAARKPWDFESEGTHGLRGKTRPVELHSLSDQPRRLFASDAEREQLVQELSETRHRIQRAAGVEATRDVRGDTGLPVIGRYEIVKELGRGAMGRVYLAHDTQISRKVAIKTLDALRDLEDTELGERRRIFFREAEAAGKLNHPGIVVIHDAGEDEGLGYIVMEYLEGYDLRRHTRPDSLLPPAVALKICGRVARALHYAHARSVIHRDIKPGNVMVSKSRDVKVTDFGIARLAEHGGTGTITDGSLIGSPAYMSPEQLLGQEIDHRSDLFALGVTLYELLCGVRPFQSGSVPALIGAVTGSPHPDIREHQPQLPEAVSRLLDKALAKRREQRFANGEAFVGGVLEGLRSLSSA